MNKNQKNILLVGLFISEKNKHLILRSSSDRLAELYQKHGIGVVKASTKVGKIARLWDTAAIIIKNRKNFDIAIVPLFGGLSLVLEDIITRLLKLLNKKVILIVRGGAIPEKMKTQAKYYLPTLKRSDVVVSPSGFTLSSLKEYGIDCLLIENVINLHEYTFNNKQSFRPKLFWMRTFEDIYNPEMAIRVAVILNKKYNDFTMVMAGHDRGSLQMVKDLSQSLGLADKVQFYGYIQNDEKNKFAHDLDFYICTNRIDNAPVSLTEVMALGMPIVTVNSGGIPFLVTDKVNALMVDLDDDEAMANAIVSIVENPMIGQQLIKNGLQYSKQFGEESVMIKWNQLFNQLGYQHQN